MEEAITNYDLIETGILLIILGLILLCFARALRGSIDKASWLIKIVGHTSNFILFLMAFLPLGSGYTFIIEGVLGQKLPYWGTITCAFAAAATLICGLSIEPDQLIKKVKR